MARYWDDEKGRSWEAERPLSDVSPGELITLTLLRLATLSS